MTFAAALLLASALYPPTQEDAARAVAAEMPGGGALSLDPKKPGYDGEVRLERCLRNESYEVAAPFGGVILIAGHECVLTISRRARPDYAVRGFFHHDGIDWRYYGPTGEPFVAETQTYGINGAFSTASPKPGSILYRGGSAAEIADPYRRIFSGYDWFYEPTDQPPHDDIYTDK
jgi:hypothetical protein